jgi:small subunit ribosomal protein S16
MALNFNLMLIIRLQRAGKKNQPDFRIVVAEKAAPVNKKIHEILGNYSPRKKTFSIKEERAQYWIAQHTEMSPTVHNLFVTKGLVTSPKVKAFSTPKKAVEPVAAAVPSAAVETPAEAAEATVEMEAKIEAATEAPAPAEASNSAEATSDKPAAETPAEAAPEQPAA